MLSSRHILASILSVAFRLLSVAALVTMVEVCAPRPPAVRAVRTVLVRASSHGRRCNGRSTPLSAFILGIRIGKGSAHALGNLGAAAFDALRIESREIPDAHVSTEDPDVFAVVSMI